MIEDIKQSLRISISDFDLEINDLIEAAKLDLKISGVNTINMDDPLIKRAITIYCKAHFIKDHQEADRYAQSYNMLKQHLSLAGDYNG